LVADNCEELRRACREMKNELYKHLKVIENIRSNIFQVAVSIILASISFLIVMISDIESYKILLPNMQIKHNISITAFLVFVMLIATCFIAFFIILKHIEKYIEKHFVIPWKTILESIRIIHDFRRNALEEYVNKLDGYCRKLINNGCTVDYDVLCSELDHLKRLIRK